MKLQRIFCIFSRYNHLLNPENNNIEYKNTLKLNLWMQKN